LVDADPVRHAARPRPLLKGRHAHHHRDKQAQSLIKWICLDSLELSTSA
jgi:hypothetical protein